MRPTSAAASRFGIDVTFGNSRAQNPHDRSGQAPRNVIGFLRLITNLTLTVGRQAKLHRRRQAKLHHRDMTGGACDGRIS